MELLPANYYFRVAYAGGSQEKWQNVASAQDVTFSKP